MIRLRVTTVVLPLLVFRACASSGGVDDPRSDGGAPPELPECDPTAPTECTDPALTYEDVLPIFAERCKGCHSGREADGPWPLTSYEHVADWAQEIRGQVLACSMPPTDAGVPITNEERERILLWIRCGFPE